MMKTEGLERHAVDLMKEDLCQMARQHLRNYYELKMYSWDAELEYAEMMIRAIKELVGEAVVEEATSDITEQWEPELRRAIKEDMQEVLDRRRYPRA